MGTAPDSLDPQFGYTTQSAEATWISYLGLLTYAHSSNPQTGGSVIPALATALPTISSDGLTYTMTLRKGLVFSNGQPVKASDFTYSVERALKIPWGGAGQFIGTTIVGAMDYASGKAKTISGITANDSTGQITIHLAQKYGAFENVLAFPALGIVPTGTPFKNEPINVPAGVGPYEIKNVVANQGFDVDQDPHWAAQAIPGVPAGHVNVHVTINSDTSSEFESVLNNSNDFADWSDTPPPSLLPQIKAETTRYTNVPFNSTYYIFLNTQTKPFNNQLAREAVVTAIDQRAFSRLGSGFLIPGCYFLPPGMLGHPTAPCPYGDPAAGGNIAKAKQLVQQSGMAGEPVTVWSETRSPRQEWMTYYTSVLNQIGFKATQKVIADATYFPTIGNLKLNPQTGFADWNQDFPNPIDFYLLITKSGISQTNNQNFGQVQDPHIDTEAARLGQVPTSQLAGVRPDWEALDQYTAQKAYVAVFGYQTFPKFASTRINFPATIFSPQYGWDYTSFAVK
jgi:peptide/nickel transport system substrate-binding protein